MVVGYVSGSFWVKRVIMNSGTGLMIAHGEYYFLYSFFTFMAVEACCKLEWSVSLMLWNLVPLSASIAREPDTDSYFFYILHFFFLP